MGIVIDGMCGGKLVEEAKFVAFKLKELIKLDGVTYKNLISGFCDKGDLIEASKIWNLMVDEGFDPDVDAVEKMMERLFKVNQFSEALKLFQTMRLKRMNELDLSTYRLVIKWLSKRGLISQAQEVFDEMRDRGVQIDNLTLGAGYKCISWVKGLLRLRREREATQVFREMIRRGCQPTMHTYIMLLQGHLGRRGRKGSDPLINFDTIFVKVGQSREAIKYVERVMNRGMEVPRFDYNKFLYHFSSEEGVVMFEEIGKKLRK